MIEKGKQYNKIKWGEKTLNNIDVTFKWNTAPNNSIHPRYTWNEIEIIQHAAGDLENEPWLKWEDKKKKKLIKLICKVQGKTITKEKEIQNYKITVKDIKLVAKEILGIEIMTENIKF